MLPGKMVPPQVCLMGVDNHFVEEKGGVVPLGQWFLGRDEE
jgi:hypothetical protein